MIAVRRQKEIPWVQLHRIKLAMGVSYFAWLSPLLIYWCLPFDIPIDLSYLTVSIALGATGLVYMLSLKGGGKVSNIVLYDNFAKLNKLPLVVYIGMFSPVFIIMDLVIFRGVVFSNSLAINRELFGQSSPTIFGYISYITSAAALLSLTLLRPGVFHRQWIIVTPYVLVSAIYLLSGNRQYVLTGLFVIYFSYLLRSNISTYRIMLITISGIVAIGTAFMAFQFSRQDFAVGQQAEHVMVIMDMSCEGAICDSPVLAPAAYLFHYYGTEYHGLSAYIENKVSTPMFSTTLPLLYKRFENVFDLETYESVRSRIFDDMESKTGIFPRTWKTMYGYIIPDFGYYGVVFFVLAASISASRAIRGLLRTGSQYHFSIVVLFITFMTIGVMYVPTAEPINALVIGMSLLRVLWAYPRYSTQRSPAGKNVARNPTNLEAI